MREVGLPLEGGPVTESVPPPSAPQAGPRVRALVDAHYDFVWRSLRRLGVRERDLDDGVQKVFMVTTSKLDGIHAGAEKSFLYQTSLRVASDARRAVRRRPELTGIDVPEEADSAPAPDELVDLRRARRELDEALSEMSLELRSVFVLFELEQLTLTEIAELLGVPRGTVASRLRCAREEFEERASRFFERRARGQRKEDS